MKDQCSICYEDQDFPLMVVAPCCAQQVHYQCFLNWVLGRVSSRYPLTCPICGKLLITLPTSNEIETEMLTMLCFCALGGTSFAAVRHWVKRNTIETVFAMLQRCLTSGTRIPMQAYPGPYPSRDHTTALTQQLKSLQLHHTTQTVFRMLKNNESPIPGNTETNVKALIEQLAREHKDDLNETFKNMMGDPTTAEACKQIFSESSILPTVASALHPGLKPDVLRAMIGNPATDRGEFLMGRGVLSIFECLVWLTAIVGTFGGPLVSKLIKISQKHTRLKEMAGESPVDTSMQNLRQIIESDPNVISSQLLCKVLITIFITNYLIFFQSKFFGVIKSKDVIQSFMFAIIIPVLSILYTAFLMLTIE